MGRILRGIGWFVHMECIGCLEKCWLLAMEMVLGLEVSKIFIGNIGRSLLVIDRIHDRHCCTRVFRIRLISE